MFCSWKKNDESRVRRHQEIFKAILNLSSKGQAVDMLLVKDELEKSGQFENIGGIDYLLSLTEEIGLLSNIYEYCKLVEEKSKEILTV